MKGVFLKAKTFLLDLLFPVECLGCGEAGTYLCAGCFARIPLEESFVCALCGRPSFESETCKQCRKHSSLHGLMAAASYRDPLVRRLLAACKYRFVRELAPHLARLILKRLSQHAFSVFHRDGLVFVPVPLDASRLRWRGFNQAQEISSVLGEALGIPVASHVLARTKKTTPQVETESREERLRNISGAFTVKNPAALCGKAVLLVDDVATTCATMNACARSLAEAGAKEVWGIVAAREAQR